MILPMTAWELISLALLLAGGGAAFAAVKSDIRHMREQQDVQRKQDDQRFETLEGDVHELRQSAISVALMEHAATRLERAVDNLVAEGAQTRQAVAQVSMAQSLLEQRVNSLDELRTFAPRRSAPKRRSS